MRCLRLARLTSPEAEGKAGDLRACIDVIRAPLFEGPPEDCGVKLFGAPDIGGCELDVIDLVMLRWMAHSSAPFPWFLSSSVPQCTLQITAVTNIGFDGTAGLVRVARPGTKAGQQAGATAQRPI